MFPKIMNGLERTPTTTDRSNRIYPRKRQMANISDQTEINWSEKN